MVTNKPINESGHRIVRARCVVTFKWEQELDSESFSEIPQGDAFITERFEEMLVDAPFDHIPEDSKVEITSAVEVIS